MRRSLFQGQVVAVATLTIIGPAFAQSYDLDKQSKALIVIQNAANSICSEVGHSGSASGLEISGTAKATLGAVIRKLTDLGIDGAAKYNDSQYNNVLQKDLADQISKNSNCRLDVFHSLVARMLPP